VVSHNFERHVCIGEPTSLSRGQRSDSFEFGLTYWLKRELASNHLNIPTLHPRLALSTYLHNRSNE
jgi:hypothetical protein